MIVNFIGDTGTGGANGLVPAPPALSGGLGYVLGAGGAWVAGGGSDAAAWHLTGNLLASDGYLGSLNAFGLNIGTNSVDVFSITSAQALTIWPSNINMPGINLSSVAPAIYYNVLMHTDGSLKRSNIQNNDPSVQTWNLAGNNNVSGLSFLGSTTATAIDIGTNSNPILTLGITGSVIWSAHSSGQAWACAGGLASTRFDLISLDAELFLELDCNAEIDLGVTGATTINIGRTAATTTLTGPNINVPSLANAVTANAVYYNTTSGLFTYGAAGGGGSGWNLTGTNSGAGLKFGTNTADGINFQVNSSNFLTVSSALAVAIASASLSLQSTGAVTLATSAATSLQVGFTGMPVTIFGSAMTISSNGSVGINANSGNITLAADGIFNTITMNGSVTHPTRLGIGNVHCSQIDIGNSATACPITVLCDTWLTTASTSVGIQSPLIHIGTTATNTSISIGGSTTSSLFGFGNSISIHSTTSSSFDSSGSVDVAATDATQLFLSSAACTTTFDATNLLMVNMPPAVGSEKIVVIDTVTGQLRISP